MGIRVRPYPASSLVALCALVLTGSCSSKSPTQPPPPVGGVAVNPPTLNFGSLNGTHQLTATVTDQSGNPITGASVTWSSSNVTVALVSGGGLVTAIANGVDTITATSGTTSGKAVVTVSQVAASVTKQAGDAQTWAVNATLPLALQVQVLDSGGSPVVAKPVTFAVASGGGSIVEHSAVTDAGGHASVHWTLGSTVGAQSVTATASPAPAATFTATGGTAGAASQIAVWTGDGQTGLDTFAVNIPPAVIVKDAAGLPVSGVTVTFAVATGGGSVTGPTPTTNANGVAAVGSWKIQDGGNTLTATAAGGSITGNPITFTATGQGAQYTIEIQYVVPVSASRHAAVDSAVAKWTRIIYGALPSVAVNIGAGQCFSPKTPAVNETITGVLIFVELDSIDGPGKVLGQAGPCFVRSTGRLPLIGLIQLDTADIVGLESNGEFGEVVLHEMGHILGYGTIWDPQDLNLLVGPAESGGTDPHFVGSQAINAFYGMGGLNYTGGAAVPVENTGGAGTADGHWRETVFHTELMTGFLNQGVANPLSVLTAASMGDLGYTVNYAGADPYTQTFSLRATGSATQIHLVNDIIRGPVYVLSPAGTIMGVIQH